MTANWTTTPAALAAEKLQRMSCGCIARADWDKIAALPGAGAIPWNGEQYPHGYCSPDDPSCEDESCHHHPADIYGDGAWSVVG